MAAASGIAIITDALTCKQHVYVVISKGPANMNCFILLVV